MKEVLNFYRIQIDSSDVLIQLGLQKNDYFLVSAHREENIDSETNFSNLLNSLSAIAVNFNKSVIVSTHPRTRKRLIEKTNLVIDSRIRFLNPLDFFDYIKLQLNAACVVSDSGTITEESSILNFPAVTIRQTHERPEGMDEGTLIMCGLESEKVVSAIKLVLSQYEENTNQIKIVNDYNVDNVSTKVLRIIFSYTEFVNKKIWFKS